MILLYCYEGGDDMEIRAKCKFDFDAIKALTHLSTYKKSNPKRTVRSRAILYFVLLLMVIAELIVFGFNFFPIILIVVALFAIAVDLFMYFALPQIQYKALAKMKNAENNYLFCDNVIKVLTKSEEYNGEAEIEYSLLVKVYETAKYFFLYQTDNQVFLVEKSTIENGSVDDIRNKLSSFVKDQYFICKY